MSKTIKELAVELTVVIALFCDNVKGRSVFVNQIIRSSSSIGANAQEAKYAQSKADFISKLQIALKECYESDYWLYLFKETNILSEDKYKQMYDQCSKIRKLLIASINTAKESK